MEQRVFAAARDGDLHSLVDLLRENSDLDINWTVSNVFASTPLHIACDFGQAESVRVLLLHPNIEVNKEDASGATPFSLACRYGHTAVVRQMLGDERVWTDHPNKRTSAVPLRDAAANNHLETIRVMISSGRDLLPSFVKEGDPVTDPVAIALSNGWKDVVALLKQFKANKVATIAESRKSLGIQGHPPHTTPFFS